MVNQTNKQFYKKLLFIALPIALQSLIASSLTLLDNLMISSLGELSLTSVGLATQGFVIHWMMCFGFCSGCATFFTQFWGVRDMRNIRKVAGLAVLSCMAFSLIFFIAGFFFPVKVLMLFTNEIEVAELGAEYLKTAAVNFLLVGLTQPFSAALRATQQTKIPMFISIGSFVADALFNYMLIFGKFGMPKMGVAGAALATVIARALECLITLLVVFAGDNVLRGKISEFFGFNKSFVKRVYANSSVTLLNETLWSMSIVAENAAYGHLGVTAYAAVQAAATIMDLFQNACFSVGDASLILIGEQIGKSDFDEATSIAGKILKLAVGLSLAVAALIIAFNRPIVSLFNLTELGNYYAYRIIIIRAACLILNLLNATLIAGILRAGGDARFAAFTEILIMWLYAVPVTFVCALVFGIPVYWVVLIAQLEGVVKLFIMVKRYRSGKWIKNMIRGM